MSSRVTPAAGVARDPIRVALVGLGSIAQVAHLPALARQKGLVLAAVCDSDAAKARTIAQRFGIREWFTDLEDLLEASEVEAVVIATPNHLHEPHVLAALKAKRDVFCERPLAFSPRGVERVLAAAERAQRRVFVSVNQRFRADTQALERFLAGGELGRLVGIRTGAYHVNGERTGWRFRRQEAGGGAFVELGIPLLDLALWLTEFPAVARVSATMDRARGATTVEHGMMVGLETETGPSIAIDVRTDYVGEKDRWWFEVLGTKGTARLAPLRIVKLINGRAADVSPLGAATRETPLIQSYRAEFARFAAVLRDEAKYEPPTEQVVVHRVIEAIYRSAEDGKEVRLP